MSTRAKREFIPLEKIHLSQEDFEILTETFPNGIVALDLETTGLSPLIDRIIEIGAYKISPKGVEMFWTFVHPEIPIPAENSQIHGITDQDVAGAQRVGPALEEFYDFLEDASLVAHNAKFDLGFILFQSFLAELSVPSLPTYCSVHLSRKMMRDLDSHKLNELCKHFNIKLDNHHRAQDDALASLKIFTEVIKERVTDDDRLTHKDIAKEGLVFNTGDFKEEKIKDIPQKIESIIPFVRDREALLIKYKGGSRKDMFRPIRPVSLLPMPQGNVLYALCYIDRQHKSFFLKKIIDFKRTSRDEAEELGQKMN